MTRPPTQKAKAAITNNNHASASKKAFKIDRDWAVMVPQQVGSTGEYHRTVENLPLEQGGYLGNRL
jgi:hypothetical protein